ncbi:MAG: hypothetical protein ABIP44_08150 [Pseudoxanthomonas sp.]
MAKPSRRKSGSTLSGAARAKDIQANKSNPTTKNTGLAIAIRLPWCGVFYSRVEALELLDDKLDELEPRFNNRDNKFLFRETLLNSMKAVSLTYKSFTRQAA